MSEAIEHVDEKWEELWRLSPQGSAFARLDYVRAIADAGGFEVGIHLIEEDGIVAAGAALTWRRRGPYRVAVVPPFTPYSALLLRAETPASEIHSHSSALDALLEELERSYEVTHLHLHPSVHDVRPATWRGWKAQPLYTYVRRNADCGVFDGWSTSAARNYRSARSEYDIVEGVAAADAAVRLCRESYARQDRTAPLPADALKRLLGRTSPSHRAFAARSRAGIIEAAVILLSDPERSYYWIAGGRPGTAMTVLVGEIIARIGTPTLDFMGANTAGIAEFKRRFGSMLESYTRLEFYSRIDVELLYRIRSFFRS